MKRRALAVVFGAIGAIGAACQAIGGIDERAFTVAPDDAASDVEATADAAEAALPDPCAHIAPPPPPDASFDNAQTRYILAIRSIDYSGADDAGAPLGLDLDGVCTCDKRPGSAHGGGSGCSPPAPDKLCDLDGGVDNGLFTLGKTYAVFAPSSYNQPIDCGKQTLLLYITGYNGLADDDHVKVGLVGSSGIQVPHDGGEATSGPCPFTSPDAGPPYPPKWDGTDTWSFLSASAQRFGPDVINPFVASDEAYVSGYTLVVPPVRTVPFFFLGADLELGSPTTIAHLELVDGGAGLRITQGLVAGRVPTWSLLSALGQLRPQSGPPVCMQPTGNFLKSAICTGVDIASSPLLDFQTDPDGGAPFACDAISLAIRFTAEPALLGDTYDPPLPDAGCPDAWSLCGAH